MKKGQLLFQIDPRPFQAEVDRLSAEAARARARNRRWPRRTTTAASGWSRSTCISQQEFEQLATDRQHQPRTTSAPPRPRCETARLNLEFTEVRSPIDGRVSRAMITAGNLVTTTELLTTVVSDNPVYAYFDTDEQTYLKFAASSADRGARADRTRSTWA